MTRSLSTRTAAARPSLTKNGGGLDAAWSPDGKRIAFASVRSGGGFRLYVMDADGKNVAQLSARPMNTNGNVYPAWSPDGQKIAFGDLVGRGPANPRLRPRRKDPEDAHRDRQQLLPPLVPRRQEDRFPAPRPGSPCHSGSWTPTARTSGSCCRPRPSAGPTGSQSSVSVGGADNSAAHSRADRNVRPTKPRHYPKPMLTWSMCSRACTIPVWSLPSTAPRRIDGPHNGASKGWLTPSSARRLPLKPPG